MERQLDLAPIFMPVPFIEELKKIAQEEGISVADVVAIAIKNLMESRKKSC